MTSTDGIQYVVIHGYRRAFRLTGSGPAILLLHGLACDSSTWNEVIEPLSEHFTVIAPDLLGHGESDKPDADYSVGGFANGMRDLLTVLGISSATVIGHSFGGGVAMQFAYQYPEMTDRVILVAPGGMGREVTPLIRMLTIPGIDPLLAVATLPGLKQVVAASLRHLSRTGLSAMRDLDEVATIYENMADPAQRRAVRRLTGNALNWRGQYIRMTDRTYLARVMPIMVVWGAQDHVLPVKHADTARREVGAANVHVLGRSGHFPHRDHPERFLALVEEFVASTEPARFHRGRWRALLRRGDQAELLVASSGAEVIVAG